MAGASRLSTILCLALTGCAMDPTLWSDAPPDLETRHLDVHLHDGAAYCPEQLEDADDYLDVMADRLGVPVTPIQYHLHPPGTSIAHCGESAAGCSVASTRSDGALVARIDATSFFMYHEGAHALAAPLGEAPAFLNEGLAVALSPHPPYYRYQGPRELSHVLTTDAWWSDPNPGALYEVAGDFVRHLIEDYGLALVRALYEAVDHGADEGTIRATFEEVIGAPLDAELERWRDGPRLPHTIAFDAVGVPQCADEGFALDPDGALEQRARVAACPLMGAPRLAGRTRAVVEIPTDGVHLLELDAPGVAAAVFDCADGELEVDHALDREPPQSVLLELSAGRHVLAFTPADPDAIAAIDVTWRLTRR